MVQRKGSSARACALIVSALFLASCDFGARQLCCGYETREDWTSDVTIVRDGGLVVFQQVSAIVELADGYIIETRDLDSNASRMAYKPCRYARIEKRTGARSTILEAQLQAAVDEQLASGKATFELRTRKSCLKSVP